MYSDVSIRDGSLFYIFNLGYIFALGPGANLARYRPRIYRWFPKSVVVQTVLFFSKVLR